MNALLNGEGYYLLTLLVCKFLKYLVERAMFVSAQGGTL